jgi:hypothetical protein
VAAVALAASVTGCVATETPVAPRGIAVSSPPPPPPPEPQRPPAPSAASVWVAGYWHWTGMQYAWIPGHWENGPPGAAWAAPRYTASQGETIYEPGRWKPATNTTANALH